MLIISSNKNRYDAKCFAMRNGKQEEVRARQRVRTRQAGCRAYPGWVRPVFRRIFHYTPMWEAYRGMVCVRKEMYRGTVDSVVC